MAEPIAVDLLDDLPKADITILGEIHDNPLHHQNQARAVTAIRPTALVFEMLSPEQADKAKNVDRADAAALAKALGWAGTGWPDFDIYAPIFAAAPDARILGAAVPRDDLRRAMSEGEAVVFGDDASVYGLILPLSSDEQSRREVEQMTAHCDALPQEMLPGMVAAQRFRDASFARTALTALRDNGGPIVVITGSGHADKIQGIPSFLATADPEVSVLSIGQLEVDPGPDAPFDLWLITAPVPRSDPCEVFEKP